MTKTATLNVFLFSILISSVTAGTDLGSRAESDEKPLSRFVFHGYVNLGYGVADGHKHRGIPEDGHRWTFTPWRCSCGSSPRKKTNL